MNKTLLTGTALAIFSALSATSAKAQLFDFQFAFPGSLNQSGAAVLGTASDPTWNNMGAYFGGGANFGTGGTVPLLDTTGAITASLTFGGTDTSAPAQPGGTNWASGPTANPLADPGTGNLFAVNIFTPASEQFVNISGLADSQEYTLELYMGGAGADPADFTVDGTGSYTGFASNASESISDGPGYAYAEMDVFSSATGTLDITQTSANGTGNYIVLNGLQLQAVAVPEPSTYVLTGLGGVLLLFVRNRRKMGSV